jgi:transposase
MHIHYNLNQLKLEVSYNYRPEEGHITYHIHEFVDSLEINYPYIFGRPRKYDFSMLLKLLLYAYSRGIFTSRSMEQLARENLPAIWLCQNEVPSYRTICRFRQSDELTEIIQLSFDEFICYLREQRLIDDHLFIDGTKILADANKYSFVWKKNTLRFEEMNREKMTDLVNEMRHYYQMGIVPEETPLTLEGLEEMITQLEVRLEDLEKTIEETPRLSPNPHKQERRKVKSRLKRMKHCHSKHEEYQTQKEILSDRNSYSKTDHDATFMRMKEDPMKNGQLKPGYNVQIATSNQFTLAYQIFSNPTDTRTLKPFFDTHSQLIHSFSDVSMDAGYGSESNYTYLEESFPDLVALIPYGTYLKEQSRKWKSDDSKVMNWEYFEEEDYYIDPLGVRFNFVSYRKRTDGYGFERNFKEYKAEQFDENHQEIKAAFTKKGYVRKITVNPSYEYFKAKQRELLEDSKYSKVYSRRKIDVEPTFGHLKACLGFVRFHVRGKKGVNNEMGLALMAANMRKLRIRKNHKEKTQKFLFYFEKFLGFFDTYVTASFV